MRFSLSTAAALLLAAADQATAQRSPRAASTNGKGPFVVDNQYKFTGRLYWDFSSGRMADWLRASEYKVWPTHEFQRSNVAVSGGYLQLKVPGGQKNRPIKGGEVVTTVNNIKYASVRTVAVFTENPGVCNGIFFYKSDKQETDIEWLSDPASQSNAGNRQVWFANQDNNGDRRKTWKSAQPPANPTSTEHEYRLDWIPGMTRFFIDGVQKWNTTKDVPSVSGPWVWNNWADGDKGWSVGPPVKDAVFKIKEIDIYYNTAPA
ncbi:hypothetical protein CCHL11_09221 [Colletotrichum chlorophyti]|uniref:GH16 domain-containing protein n=1 Tax=Colletotrichum chlorophyti TaxID=708187 RepID=A0A1Q8RNC2_9PEZI|nr:hypothetical protein CCHL11_09221 [Colletotrichum chlorophyti]